MFNTYWLFTNYCAWCYESRFSFKLAAVLLAYVELFPALLAPLASLLLLALSLPLKSLLLLSIKYCCCYEPVPPLPFWLTCPDGCLSTLLDMLWRFINDLWPISFPDGAFMIGFCESPCTGKLPT